MRHTPLTDRPAAFTDGRDYGQEASGEDQYLIAPMSESVARANKAATVCERAAGIAAEAAQDERAERLIAYKRAREAAAMAARADRAARLADNRADRYRLTLLAARFCEAAEAEAEGLNVPDDVWTEPGADEAEVVVAQQDARIADAQAEMCDAEPSKRASQGRYNKGCRCDSCKRVNAARTAERKRKARERKG